MEQAFFLNRLREPLPDGYSRLYFGAEFCPWMFPNHEALVRALEAARLRGWSFTLATPVITEAFLPRLRRALSDFLPLLDEGDEVLVSDFGAIGLIREIAPSLPLILGRALSGQKRGPRILDLDPGEAQLAYFRRCSWHAAESVRLLSESGLMRLELDNLLQGLAPLTAGLPASLHYPFLMVTSSRNCPYRRWTASEGCEAGCGEAFRLTTDQCGSPLLQRGNTQFIRNDILPGNPASLGVDRLVFHPHLPC